MDNVRIINPDGVDATYEDLDIEAATRLLKSTTGLDVESEHGSETPKRFVKMLREMTTRPENFEFTMFENTRKVDEMVVMTNVEFYTFCNHHVVPFFGMAHIAYIPDKSIVGLSKLARTVEWLAKGLWVQEHLTDEIAGYLDANLEPKGVGVVMDARHLCMGMRGVKMPEAITTTAAMRGVFSDHDRTAKAEFMAHIERHKQ